MVDHRLAPIRHVICQFYGICDCNNGAVLGNCCIDIKMIESLLGAIDQADHEHGIVRVPIVPDSAQLVVGLRCAMHGESPGKMYEQMVKAKV